MLGLAIVIGLVIWVVGWNNLSGAREATHVFVEIGVEEYKQKAKEAKKAYLEKQLKELE